MFYLLSFPYFPASSFISYSVGSFHSFYIFAPISSTSISLLLLRVLSYDHYFPLFSTQLSYFLHPLAVFVLFWFFNFFCFLSFIPFLSNFGSFFYQLFYFRCFSLPFSTPSTVFSIPLTLFPFLSYFLLLRFLPNLFIFFCLSIPIQSFAFCLLCLLVSLLFPLVLFFCYFSFFSQIFLFNFDSFLFILLFHCLSSPLLHNPLPSFPFLCLLS